MRREFGVLGLGFWISEFGVRGCWFGVRGSGFGVRSLEFRLQGAGCRVQGAGCRVQGAGCRVQGAGCRVQGAGCRVQGAGCRGSVDQVEDEERGVVVGRGEFVEERHHLKNDSAFLRKFGLVKNIRPRWRI